MKKYILIFLLPFLCALAHAAQGEEFLQPYTPNTYAFARYGDLPVDHSTGIPQITIPLTHLGDRDLRVDVSLSYYASGIKVDQEASWVGLGWSLNAGGMITRQVRGVPDHIDPQTGKMIRMNLKFFYMEHEPNESPEQFMKREYTKWRIAASPKMSTDDFAPDIFYFNFCGRTGQFYLDADGQGRMIDQDDCTIRFLPDGNFRITDERGAIYTFKDKEYVHSTELDGSYPTAWYLSSITSPSGGRITFSYESGGTLSGSVVHRVDETYYMSIYKDATTHSIFIPRPSIAINYSSNRWITGLVLKSIRASSGARIDFTCKNENRKDAVGVKGSMLETITAFNSAGASYKKYKFSYTYFQPDNRHKRSEANQDFLNYRLRLDNLQELSTEGTAALPPYRFSYYGDGGSQEDNVYALPYRMSPCQDHWGYYNYSNNKNLFPNNGSKESFYIEPWYELLADTGYEAAGIKGFAVTGGGNRDMHKEAMKACTLKKITYPTGGNTQFEFETHDTDYSLGQIGMGGLRIKKITDDDGEGNLKVRTYEYPQYSWGDSKYHLVNNFYHVWYHQRIEGPNIDHERRKRCISAFGIPSHLIDEQDILQIRPFPAMSLGTEGDFMYPQVTERVQGKGRTEYAYTYERDDIPYLNNTGLSAPGWSYSEYEIYNPGDPGYPSTIFSLEPGFYDFPFMTPPDLSWRRGQLKSRKVYTEEGTIVESEEMTYDEQILSVEPGHKVVGFSDYEYMIARDYLAGGRTRLSTRTTWRNGVSTTRKYTYAPGFHKLIAEIEETTSRGDEILTKYKYAHDYNATAHAGLDSLVKKHILAPVDVRTYRDGTMTHGEQIAYNSAGQPTVTYRAEGEVAFNRGNPYTFVPCFWRRYNDIGLLIEEKDRTNGIERAYLWRKNGEYPVIMAEGVNHATLSGWLSPGYNNLLISLPESELEEHLLKAREELKGKDLMLTTCMYIPQVGMQSLTRPNGEKYSYEYDAFKRLKSIKNHKNQTVEEYEYHYKQ